MSNSNISIGLVGCGRWGKNILRDLVALGCKVNVVARCAASHDNARRGGATRIAEQVDDLPPCAGIVVASPASTHADVLTALLPRQVPIFCEKPLTTDVTAARRLAAQAADRIFVMDKWRYHPGILELASIGRSGELGQILGLRTNRNGWNVAQTDVDCAWTLLPHELTIALEILGHVPKPQQATAERAADGTLLSLHALLGKEAWHRTEISIGGPQQPRTVELVCADGVAILPDAGSDHVLLVHDGLEGGRQQRRPISSEQPLFAELQAFVKHLQGGASPRSSIAEAVKVVETIAEVRRMADLASQDSGAALAA